MSKNNDNKSEKALPELEDWELALVEVFCRACSILGLRRSVGMVYGMLYCSREPLAITDLQEKLQLSRGACVEATQLLRRFGAINLVLRIGSRKDYFEVETELKKFVAGTLREIILPGIEKISQRLDHASSLAHGNAAKEKIKQLIKAKDALAALVPAIENFFGK